MNDTHVPNRGTVIALSIAVCCTALVVPVVNYLIYTARWEFAERNPDYVAKLPATISRAISDPAIGAPFANWMLVCAPVLFLGVLLMLTSFLRELKHNDDISPDLRRIIMVLTAALIVLQAMASVGMVMLSQYTFPVYINEHMTGSFLFFISQAFVVFGAGILSRLFERVPPKGRVVNSVMGRLRRWLLLLPGALAVVYLGLFVGKDMVPNASALHWPVHQTYVTVELLLISAFLLYLFSWVPDCIFAIGRYLRS